MNNKLYKMMDWPSIEAIVYGDDNAPDKVLGRHSANGYTLYQAFLPDAEKVELKISGSRKVRVMEKVDEEGFFAEGILGKELKDYTYKVTNKDGKTYEMHDPYIFDASLKGDLVKRWNKGEAYDAYEFMGAHKMVIDDVEGVCFRVWAPNAIRVSLVGEFNNWNGLTNPMIFDEKTGVFSIFMPDMPDTFTYKYEVRFKGGECSLKADPYALFAEKDLDGASIYEVKPVFKWEDETLLPEIRKVDTKNGILNVFEINNNYSGKFTKAKIDEICKYVVDAGYTHVLMDITSNRFFCMDDMIKDSDNIKKLVNALHKVKVGVMFRFNPCYFSLEESGLKYFDGTYLYGHLDERKRYNPKVGFNFNYGREQVKNYLYSCINYWFDNYHMDGIHVDEISSVLYLDYCKNEGQWAPNMYGGNENLEAIEFIKGINSIFHKKYKGIISSTKETCMFRAVTAEIKDGGLGFDYIFDNGFAEDYLRFLQSGLTDIYKITDSMSYAYSENYILTISKEDVLASLDYSLERFLENGSFFDFIEDEKKEAVKKTTLAYMMARPGKKLLYIGQDDSKLSKELGKLYKEYSAFHSLDRKPEGFEWINAMNDGTGVVAFLRKDEYINKNIFVVCNFSQNNYEEFKFGMPYEGKYKAIFSTAEERFGGESKLSSKVYETTDEEYNGRVCTLNIPLEAMSVAYYTYTPFTEKEFLEFAKKKADRIRKELEEEANRRAKELETEARRKAKEYNRK